MSPNPDKDASCLFCKIVDKHIPSNMVKDASEYVAIRDINPQAPTHVLIISKNHVRNIAEFEDAPLLGRLFQAAKDIAWWHRIAPSAMAQNKMK